MTGEPPLDPHVAPERKAESKGWLGRLRGTENLVLSLSLAAMVILPLAEICLRKAFHTGISGASAFLQHFTLIVGLLGGALAAREGRLLALSTLTNFLKGRWKALAQILSGSFAAAISVFLCVASLQFVLTEKDGGKILAYGIPIWVIQLVLPLGFTLIALRLLWRASAEWKGRLIALLIAGALVGLALRPPASPDHLVVPALCALVAAMALGAPIFVMLGGAALILFWGESLPIASISLTHYSMVTNPTLPTIPLFTLAGYFLAEGGASKRLVRVFQAIVGPLRGGPALITVLMCAFFTSFTGASGVTILALGGLLLPVLVAARYSERTALGLLTGSGGLGLLFPPSLPLILFAIVASSNVRNSGVTIEKMFLAGLGPGILLVTLTALWGISRGPKESSSRPSFNWHEASGAIWEAKWELLLPVVALVALFGGFATPVEAAAVTALYAFFVETVVYRDLKLARDIPRVMSECGLLVGGVLLILGVALGFTNYLIDAQVPTKGVEWMTGAIKSKYVFLLVLNVGLLLVGCLMDIFSAIVVVVPLLVPLGIAYGIDPIHLGIIFLANMELGLLTPTVGINLFLSSYRFGKPVLEVTRAVFPMQIVLLTGVLLITYIPPLTTALPQWIKGGL
ncbi:MAG: TRAP transporter large permease subunit [Verrucomicrobia bacterium]|nr:TRAP transporter large permease subunit [Verrucomicrobiota bacterium]